MKKLLFSVALTFATLTINAQTKENSVEGYSFAKYPAKTEKVTKAKLNLTSNSLGKTYKTQISNQYKTEKINFGGHYVLTFWGAGAGLTQGAMIDAKTGKIYELPLTEQNSIRDCVYNDNENIFYKPDSNLFATFKCEPNKDEKIKLTYSFYKWDGKQFKFIGKKERITNVE
ncbi:hypothetical protein CO230_03990 [Chryseobacterium sp. 6424]|uniref:hypothetical protein n=1 Tax=Chryseobacterium sp. 6424 TaxID=2039166 RepID=UPI000EFBBF58|nr:hypothetical protein [Chryseobacterium sp. 6424]AYO57357.1 hypothetical protein CO230_03990 [Chryseobacterium sp. 6424]